jgi:hypothetical protein
MQATCSLPAGMKAGCVNLIDERNFSDSREFLELQPQAKSDHESELETHLLFLIASFCSQSLFAQQAKPEAVYTTKAANLLL